MRRFLQHVLPRGCHKVRYFGLWRSVHCHSAARVRQMLQLEVSPMFDLGRNPPSRHASSLAPSQCRQSSRGSVRTVIRG